MKELKATPGPWNIGFDDGSGICGGRCRGTYITAPSVPVMDGEPWVTVCVVQSSSVFKDLPIAENAHLIAAAPDMYEALEDIGKAITLMLRDRPVRGLDEILLRRDKALKKARGEQ
jgi:hypothetical protein